MVLDPLTAIGLAGNIVQFVDFSSKIVGKANKIYESVDGASTRISTLRLSQTLYER